MKKTALLFLALFIVFPALAMAGEISTSQSEQVNASPDEVWALLIDADNWASWNSAVKTSKITKGNGSDVGSVVTFNPIIGGKDAPKVKLKLEKSDEPNTYAFSSKAPGIQVIFGFTIIEKDGGCEVTSYETITGPGASGFKAIYGQDGLDQEHRTWVEDIKKKLESK
jgi:carbon monoxide dehydrogenase subunit G